MNKLMTIALATALLFGAGQARADVLTYTESAKASGSLNGTHFTDAEVILTFAGDTALVAGSGTYTISGGPVTVSVVGIGTDTFAEGVQVLDVQSASVAGFGSITQSRAILGTSASAFGTYDLKTPIGPITGGALFSAGVPFATSQGVFIIDSSDNSTFQASAVPEPASILLLSTIMLGVACQIRRKLA